MVVSQRQVRGELVYVLGANGARSNRSGQQKEDPLVLKYERSCTWHTIHTNTVVAVE